MTRVIVHCLCGLLLSLSWQAQSQDLSTQVRYQTLESDGVNIFYREAGKPSDTAIVLLHGFPSSSHMYRDLLPKLSDDFYLIAPDYPGYGYSEKKSIQEYKYTFENVASTMDEFLSQKGLKRYVLMVHDFGAPIGFRIATKHPEKVAGIIVMNGNIYEEGLGKGITALVKLIRTPKAEAKIIADNLSFDALKWQHTHGTRSPSSINPDSWHHDYAVMSQNGVKDVNLDMLFDYKNNLPLYSVWQKFLRVNQPPLLVVWGKNDAIFTENGAAAYKNDVKSVDYNILNTGHFALNEDATLISEKMRAFLNRIEFK
ncbi:alpha/beta fold hydrolase [Agarilytica rhodophyticola]|uniref:alpha/beta fold hydrolase n=1 Tax=Agarilytica rhodophyticola TaxID=1737490 RepID=UPI000B342817|nr:alpha/beta hydrolase [Agarilytica rhodophyticola]